MGHAIVPNETYHVVDSMPLEICRFSRAARSRICREDAEQPPIMAIVLRIKRITLAISSMLFVQFKVS